jgi:anti-repressor protein
MTQLLNIKGTMNSREIAELTGKLHKDVLKAIRAMEPAWKKVNGRNFSLTFIIRQLPNGGSRKDPVYELTKKECLYIATKFNDEARAKLINRWEQLENERMEQHNIPQTFSQALMLAAKQAEKLELQSKQIQELEPKADFYDAVTDSKTAIDIGRAAKVLDMGIGRNKLFQKLRDEKILMYNNIPYQEYIDRGYFRVIESKYQKPDGSTHIQLKTLVYQKGMTFIRNLFAEK